MNKRGKNKCFSHYDFFPKNRRGSHVEIIISFIIFIVFVLFLLSILVPSINTQKDKSNIFDGVEAGIINKVSSNLTVITVNFDDDGSDCVDLNALNIGKNIVVKDESGAEITSSADENSLQINKENPSDTFFKIYYSEEFDELTGSGCSPTGYEIGLEKTSQYIFEKKFLSLMNENYDTLKKEINAPEGVNFGYGIILSNGTTFETSNQEAPTNIYIRETPIEYVDLNGNIQEGYIKTKIW
jgi:competence protein ComGC